MVDKYLPGLEPPIVNHVARKSLKWFNEHTFSFIWDNEVITADYNAITKDISLLTPVEDYVEEAIFLWLDKELKRGTLMFPNEE